MQQATRLAVIAKAELDGRVYTMQYFERACSNTPETDHLQRALSQLGTFMYKPSTLTERQPSSQPYPGRLLPETARGGWGVPPLRLTMAGWPSRASDQRRVYGDIRSGRQPYPVRT